MKRIMAHKFTKKVPTFLREFVWKWHPLTNEIDSRIDKRWVVSRCMVLNTQRYCYFRIPKCANSTIVRTLAYYDPKLTFDPKDLTGEVIKSEFNLLFTKALTISSFTKKYFLFTFVRNPYSRILSAYLDKIEGFEEKFAINRESVGAFSDSGQDLTFEAFVSYLENGGLYKNPHWTPQTLMLPVSIKELDFVGRVENLDEDLKYIVNRLFGEGVYKEPITKEVFRTNSSNKLLQYYDKELAKRVYRLYESDFDSFSYPKDISICLT
jgi:hypothetical protein